MQERIEKTFEKSEKYTAILSAWEKGFLESLKGQLDKGHTLSSKQHNTFAKIEGKLSNESIQATINWHDNWDDEKKCIAKVCASYYAQTPYFKSVAHRILEESEWVVPRPLFQRMTENKHAKKVLTAYFSEPKYADGATVMLRSGARAYLPFSLHQAMRGQPLFVLGVAPIVRSAAKDSKVYRIIAPGSITPVEIEERYIKAYKVSKKKTSKKTEAADEISF